MRQRVVPCKNPVPNGDSSKPVIVSPAAQPVGPREHGARLWRLIAHELQPHDIPAPGLPWDQVLGPLHMATSIDQVNADTSFVDVSDSVAYCRPAAEYEDARSALVSRYVRDLTVFVWTWIALEKTIDVLCRQSNDRIADAVTYISGASDRSLLLVCLTSKRGHLSWFHLG